MWYVLNIVSASFTQHVYKSTLLRYNVYIIKAIHFKCILWYVLTNVSTCVQIHLSRYAALPSSKNSPFSTFLVSYLSLVKANTVRLCHSGLDFLFSSFIWMESCDVLFWVWLLWHSITFLNIMCVSITSTL